MPRTRFIPRPYYDTPTAPFVNAEEAWFWFMRCQRAREEGAEHPDDLYRAAVGLLRKRQITAEHLRVLAFFGVCERPPDPRCRDEERSARLWDEALDKLTTVLKKKGIIE